MLLSVAVVFFAYGCGYSGLKNGGGGVDIWTAVDQEDLGAIEEYAKNGGDLETGAAARGETPLLFALQQKRKESYEKLLSLGASPNKICRGGRVVIQQAAATKKESFWLREALAHGGDANLNNDVDTGQHRGRPICLACYASESLENIKLLVEHGADINSIDLNQVPITHAAQAAQFEIVHYLLERGANYNEPVLKELTFIYYMKQVKPQTKVDPDTKKWCLEVLKWFADQGKPLDTAEWNGERWVFK